MTKPPEDLKKYQPLIISIPHFSTIDIHTNYIDCIKFFGNCILSKDVEKKIVLWIPYKDPTALDPDTALLLNSFHLPMRESI